MPKTIFEKIADKELPGYIIWEDNAFIAFLNINPLSQGHTLVVPRKNLGDYIFDLDEQIYMELMKASRHVAKTLKQKLDCDRVLMAIEGFEVPHVHVHLIPTTNGTGLAQMRARQANPEELERIMELIK